jgi:hypothetical protein
MTETELAKRLEDYCRSFGAMCLARRFHADPTDHLGEVFVRMRRQVSRLATPIREPSRFITVNARCHLMNILCETSQQVMRQGGDGNVG